MNALSPHAFAFGSKLPPPPPHVPARYRESWETLPACCRDFYLKPNQGCCAGQPEPNPGMMAAPAVPPAKRGLLGFLASTGDWFREFFAILWRDLRSLFRPKG